MLIYDKDNGEEKSCVLHIAIRIQQVPFYLL